MASNVAVVSDAGPGQLIKKAGNANTNIPLPNGITAANFVSCKVTFDSSGALWAYFSQYPFTPPPTPPNSFETGSGLFYTTAFTIWKKPPNEVDTALFRSIKAIGDSVFAIPQNFDGVHDFKKLPAGSKIIIQSAVNGECILNTNQTVSYGGKFTVSDAKRLKVTGALNIVQN